MRGLLAASALMVAGLASGSQAEEPLAAERAFAFLMFGMSSEDPCAHTSQGTLSCATSFSEKRVEFADAKASQRYEFAASPCIVTATTDVVANGKRYEAVFNLQNVQFVNLSKRQQEGNLMEVEFLFQGKKVIEADGKAGNVLVIIHKYFATADGDVGHDIKAELVEMRKKMKEYQDRFCPTMG